MGIHLAGFIRTHTVVLLSVVVISAVTTASSNDSTIVTENAIEKYAQTYLKTYNDLTEAYVSPDYWKDFPFYENCPYNIIATISTIHGAALQFTPSDAENFQPRIVNERVEQAIFQDEDSRAGIPVFEVTGPNARFLGYPNITMAAHISSMFQKPVPS